MKALKTKHFIRGGQIISHNLRMLMQINRTVILFYLWSVIIITSIITYLITPYDILHNSYSYYHAKFLNLLGQTENTLNIYYGETIYPQKVTTIIEQTYLKEIVATFWHYLIISSIISIILSTIIVITIIYYMTKKGKKHDRKKFIQGTQLINKKRLIKMIKKNREASEINIDGLPLLKDSEVRHIIITGTVGTGKTQLIMKLLDQIRKRGDRVIIYDKGPVFIKYYYRESRDFLLNPFDKRSVNWDFWQEGTSVTIYNNITNSLIPMPIKENDPFWISSARTILTNTLYKMQKDKDRTIYKLKKLLLGDLDEIRKYLQNTEAETLVNEKIERTVTSIKAVLINYLTSLKILEKLDNNYQKFSLTKWIKDEKEADKFLFITTNGEQHATLRSPITMWLNIAMNAVLSLKEEYNRRIWFIIDELPSLNRLEGLTATIAESRKFGGCFVLGLQSYAQLSAIYGGETAKEISDLANSRFYFRSPSYHMAKLTSLDLGEEEIKEKHENYSYGINQRKDGITVGSHKIIRPLVLYSQIMDLPNLNCFVRYIGTTKYPITKLKLKLEADRDQIAKPFIPQAGENL